MKRMLALVALVGFVGLAYYVFTTKDVQEYVQPVIRTEVVVEEREVPTDEMRIQAAQEAARAEIEANAQKAYDDMYDNEMDKIEAQVLKEIEAEIKARRLEVEENITAY